MPDAARLNKILYGLNTQVRQHPRHQWSAARERQQVEQDPRLLEQDRPLLERDPG
ncbi:hypothetical protein [Micromonospora sp. S-DT3-3-22]|uniref:hypothetical protein n=1 Tax=Micromonospora sp. S-DT3-3-22 TaxID=2755359 RepID=UPI001E62E20D|nr:hypothetical protein [Micromonospora sp. S-DT3-3-22]